MSSFVTGADDGLTWQLLYTKPHAEAWVEANLRRQGFATLLPRTPTKAGTGPLFPRYVFAGCSASQRPTSFAGTYGVAYIGRCGAHSARIPNDISASINARMNEQGVVRPESLVAEASIFATRARERVAILASFAAAGFRDSA